MVNVMLKSTKKAYDRLLSWSNREIYFDDVYRTLVQTGIVFVCKADIFEVQNYLKQLGISLDSINITSNYGGYFVSMKTVKKRSAASKISEILKLQDHYNKH
jgi:hypothetical protein